MANVTLVHAAVTKKNGTIGFYTPKKITDYSWGNTSRKGIYKTGTFNTQKVKAVRLSEYITSRVDFLKLDVEGAEMDVLVEIQHKLHLVKEMVMELHAWNHDVVELYAKVKQVLTGHMIITDLREVGAITSRKITEAQLQTSRSKYYLIRAIHTNS